MPTAGSSEREEDSSRVFGLPPACILSWGTIVCAILTCGTISLSRHAGLLSADPLIAPCSPEMLKKAPTVLFKMKRFPEEIKGLSRSLPQNISRTTMADTPSHQRAHMERVAERITAMLHVSHDARKLLRCGGGAKSLAGADAAKVEHMHRVLWRLYGRARKQAPTTQNGAARGSSASRGAVARMGVPRRSRRGTDGGNARAGAGTKPMGEAATPTTSTTSGLASAASSAR